MSAREEGGRYDYIGETMIHEAGMGGKTKWAEVSSGAWALEGRREATALDYR